FDRELRPGTHRKMRRVRRVAYEHHVAVRPRRVFDRDAIAPQRAVPEQAMALELFLEEGLAEFDRVGFARPIESRLSPRGLRGLDNERRMALLVLVGGHPPQPALLPFE